MKYCILTDKNWRHLVKYNWVKKRSKLRQILLIWRIDGLLLRSAGFSTRWRAAAPTWRATPSRRRRRRLCGRKKPRSGRRPSWLRGTRTESSWAGPMRTFQAARTRRTGTWRKVVDTDGFVQKSLQWNARFPGQHKLFYPLEAFGLWEFPFL